MCNFIFNTLFSMHYNRCTNSERKRPTLLLRRRSSPALPILNRRGLESEKSNISLPAVASDDLILAKIKAKEEEDGDDSSNDNSGELVQDDENVQNTNSIYDKQTTSQESFNETDESDDPEDYDQFDTTNDVCGCGKTLSKGWVCNDCRVQCPECNRFLSTDPEDYCSRCYFKCQQHGLVAKQKEIPRFQFKSDACHLCKNNTNTDLPSPSDNTKNNDQSS